MKKPIPLNIKVLIPKQRKIRKALNSLFDYGSAPETEIEAKTEFDGRFLRTLEEFKGCLLKNGIIFKRRGRYLKLEEEKSAAINFEKFLYKVSRWLFIFCIIAYVKILAVKTVEKTAERKSYDLELYLQLLKKKGLNNKTLQRYIKESITPISRSNKELINTIEKTDLGELVERLHKEFHGYTALTSNEKFKCIARIFKIFGIEVGSEEKIYSRIKRQFYRRRARSLYKASLATNQF